MEERGRAERLEDQVGALDRKIQLELAPPVEKEAKEEPTQEIQKPQETRTAIRL